MCSVKNSSGGSKGSLGVLSNLTLRHSYFIFMEKSGKINKTVGKIKFEAPIKKSWIRLLNWILKRQGLAYKNDWIKSKILYPLFLSNMTFRSDIVNLLIYNSRLEFSITVQPCSHGNAGCCSFTTPATIDNTGKRLFIVTFLFLVTASIYSISNCELDVPRLDFSTCIIPN